MSSVADASAFVKAYDHYEKYGFGRWSVINKADNQFLGWCGLKYSPHLDEVDLGFRLMKPYWGKGYATEAGAACLAYGFKKYDLKMIVGRAMAANKASIRVLEKLGMSYWKTFDFDGAPGCYYRIYNEAAHSARMNSTASETPQNA